MAAYLDSMNMHTVQEIADIVGMKRPSVSRLRSDPRYQQQVEEYREKGSQEIDHLLSRIRYDVADAYKDALKTINSMLTAEDPDGHPIWSVRAKGVDLLNNSPVFKSLFSDKSQGEVGSVAAASAIVTVLVQRSEDGTETIQYTSKTEEVQDADWETADDGDDHADEDPEGD